MLAQLINFISSLFTSKSVSDDHENSPKIAPTPRVALELFLESVRETGSSHSTVKNYASDISQFLINASATTLNSLFQASTLESFFKDQESKGLKHSSIQRKFVSIKQFAKWLTQSDYLDPQRFAHLPFFDTGNVPLDTSSDSQKFFAFQGLKNLGVKSAKSPQGATFSWMMALQLFALALFSSFLVLFGYRQFFSQSVISQAFPTDLVRPSRVLSFQGRLTDTVSNPITTSTNVSFKLFDAETVGTELWASGTCSIDPDQDGIFSTLLGSSCGSEIASSVFTENQEVWLEVTVGAETLTPRQRIATVAYALNSETLQGFPINATESATTNTVVVMNEWGEIVLGETSPKIKSVSGNFTLEGQTITLQTAPGTNGDINISPDGSGQTLINSDLEIGGYATVSASLSVGTYGAPAGPGNAVFSGRVGIGTANPSQALQVVGSAQITNIFGGPDGSNRYFIFNNNGSSLMSGSYYGWASTSSDAGGTPDTKITRLSAGKLSIDTSTNGNSAGTLIAANIGIGDTTPLYALTVGNNDLFGVNSSGAIAAATGITSSGTITFSTLNTAGGVVYTNGSGVLATSAAGASNDCLLSGGTGAPTWGSCATGTTNYWGIANGALYASNTTTDLLIGGTASNSAKFAVLNVNSGTPTASISGSTAGYALSLTGDGVISTTLNRSLALNPNGGNVGIGTTTPSQRFAVGSAFTVDTSGNVVGNRITSNDNFHIANSGSRLYWGSNFSQSIQFTTGTGMIFSTGSEAMRINTSGNVGIGTTGPDARLDSLATSGEQLRLTYTDGSVYTGFTVNASGNLSIDNSGTTTTFADSVLINGNSTFGDASGDTVTVNAATWNFANDTNFALSGGVNGLSFDTDTLSIDATNDRVGIGTSSPTERLSVNGNVKLTNVGDKLIGLTNFIQPETTDGDINFASKGDITLNLDSDNNQSTTFFGIFKDADDESGGELFRVQENGNIGIGDTTPTYMLTVGTGDLFGVNSSGAIAAATGITSSGTITFSGLNTAGGIVYTNGSGVLATSAAGSTSDCLLSGGTGAPTWGSCAGAVSSSILWQESAGTAQLKNSTLDLLVGGTSSASAKFAVLNVNSGTPTASISGSTAGYALSLTGNGVISTTLNRSLALNPNGGNVGIGTATPNSLLSIGAPETTFANNPAFTLYGTSAGQRPYLLLRETAADIELLMGADTSSGSQAFFGTTTNHDLQIRTNNTVKVTVTAGGNVGIANASANRPLSFANSTGEKIALFASSATARDYYGFGVEASTLAYQVPSGTNHRWYNGSNTHMILNSSGNLGIGSSGPDARIDALSTTEQLRLTYTDGSVYTSFTTNSSGDLTIAPSGGDFSFTGNLDVSGTLTAGTADAFSVNSSGAIAAATGITSSGTITLSGLNTAGGVVITNGSGVLSTVAGSQDQCLISNGTSAPSWGACTDAALASKWNITAGALHPINTSTDLLVGGTSTASAKFALTNVNSGAPTLNINDSSEGLALQANSGAGYNTLSSSQSLRIETVSGNITLSAASTAGDILMGGDVNVVNASNDYKISNTTVLNSTTLGSGITTSSLTTVGALSSGSIASGFGTIATANTITGTTLNGTTGINTGATAGTQRIDASGNLVNIGSVTASGTITFSALNTAGGVVVTDGSGVLSTVAGGSGNCLISNGTSAPSWGSCATGTASYWQLNNTHNLSASNLSYNILLGHTATASANTILNADGSAIFNEQGLDRDFRIETDALSHAFFVDASTDRIGFGTSTPAYQVQFHNSASQADFAISTDVNVGSANTTQLSFVSDLDGTPSYASIGQYNTGGLKFSGVGNLVSPDMFIDSTTGNTTIYNQLGVGALASSDYLVNMDAHNTGDFSRALNIIQNNNAGSETNYGMYLANTSTLSSGATSAYGIYQTLSPTITADTTQKNIRGIENVLSLSNTTLSGGTLGDVNLQGYNTQITGTPTINVTAGDAELYVYGVNSNVNVTPTLTSVPTGSSFVTRSGLFTNPSTSAGNANLTATADGIYVSSTGNLTTTGTTMHRAGYFQTGGTADTNYGVYISSSGATSNYALYSIAGTSYLSDDLLVGATSENINNTGFVLDGDDFYASGMGGFAGNVYTNGSFIAGASTTYGNGSISQSSGETLTIGSTAAALTLQTTTSGNIVLNSAGTIELQDNTNITGNLDISGSLTAGTADAFTVNTSGAITAATGITSSGTITLSGLNTAGGVVVTNGSGVLSTVAGSQDQCLLSNGTSAPSWGSCSGGLSNYWGLSNGALYALNTTTDFLIGGTASSAAKFAILNVNSGTPTASISANSGALSTYLTGDGTLATTNRNNLTIGNSSTYNTTGNVLIHPNGTGNVGIGTTALPLARLDVEGSASISGTLNFRGTTDPKINVLNGESFGIRTSRGGDAGLSERFTVLSNGNVGIGTATPDEQLHVDGGTARITFTDGQNLIELGDTTATFDWAFSQSSNDLRIEDNNGAITPFTIQTLTGNVGIGDTTPDALLSVGSSSQFQVSSAGIITKIDNVAHTIDDISGNLTLTSNSSLISFADSLDVTGNITIGGTTETISNTGFSLSGDDLFVSGMGGFEGNVYTDGSFIAGASTTYSNGSISQSSGETLTMGTTAAALTLQTTTSGNIILNSAGSIELQDNTNVTGALAATSTITGTTINGTTGINTGATAGTQRIDASGNFLNVRSITSDSTATTTSDLGLYSSGSTNWMRFTTNTGDFKWFSNYTNGTAGAPSAGQEIMTLESGGILDVNGGVQLGASDAFIVNASGEISKIDGVSHAVTDNAGNLSIDSAGTATIITDNLTLDGNTITASSLSTFTTAATLSMTSTSTLNLGTTANINGALFINTSDEIGIGAAPTDWLFEVGSATKFSVDINGEIRSIGGVLHTIDTASGELRLASAGTNVYISDDLRVLGLSTAGGVIVSDATGVLSSVAGSATQCLISNGTSAPSWGSCGGGSSQWDLANGAIYALNNTVDLLIGGNSTASAKFAFTNMNTGTPTLTTTGNIVGGIVNATTTINTGAGTGTGRIDANGNFINIRSINKGSTIPTTNDFGFYSEGTNNWVRFVSNNGKYSWYSNYANGIDNSPPTNSEIMSLDTDGSLDINGDFTAGDANYFQVNGNGEISRIDNVAHTLTDSSGNLSINSNGTRTIIVDDLQISGNDLLDSAATTRLTLGATNTFAGALSASGIVTSTTTGFRSVDGTNSAPSYSFTSDTNTGMYSAAADVVQFSVGGTNKVNINTAGIQLIHTASATTCDGTLEGTILYNQDAGENGNMYYCRQQSGGNYSWFIFDATNQNTTSLPDLAEYAWADDASINGGDLVSVTESSIARENYYDRFDITRATNSSTQKLIGVVSSDPSIILNKPNTSSDVLGEETAIDPLLKPLTLAGRVPVKIVTDTPLSQGDRIGLSQDIPGVGSKLEGSGYSVGTVLTALNPSTTTCTNIASATDATWPKNQNDICYRLPDGRVLAKVLVMVNNEYYFDPADMNTILADTQQFSLNDFGQLSLQSVNDEFVIVDSEGNTLTQLAAFARAIIGNLEVGILNAQKLIASVGQFTNSIETPVTRTNLISPLDQEDLTIMIGDNSSSNNDGNLIVQNSDQQEVFSIDENGNTGISGSLEVNQDASISGQLTATSARLQQLESQFAKINELDVNTATVSGQLYLSDGRTIESMLADNAQFMATQSATPQEVPAGTYDTFLNQLTGTDDASIANLLAALEAEENITLTSDDVVLNADGIFVHKYLGVQGLAQLNTVDVSGILTVGNNLALGQNSIASLGQTLEIQPTGVGSIKLLAGLMTLSDTGHVVVTGDLTVTGALAAGSVHTNTLQPDTFGQDLSIKLATTSAVLGEKVESNLTFTDQDNQAVATISANGSARFRELITQGVVVENAQDELKQTVGSKTLSAGSTELVINNNMITDSSLIYITPTSDTQNQVLFVKAKNACTDQSECQKSFTVGINVAITQPIEFNYWIVSVQQ